MDEPIIPLLDSTAILKGLCQLNDYIDEQTPAEYWRQGLALFCQGLQASALRLHLYEIPAGLREAGCTFGRFSVVTAAYLDAWQESRQAMATEADANRVRQIEKSPQLVDGCRILHAHIFADQRTQGTLSVVFSDGMQLSSSDEALFGQMARSFVGNGLRAEKMHLADRQLERANLIYQIGQTISGSLNMHTVLDQATQLATSVLNAEAAALYRVDSDRQQLVFMAAKEGYDPSVVAKSDADRLVADRSLGDQPVAEQRAPLGEGIAGQVASDGEALFVNKPVAGDAEQAWRRDGTGLSVRSIVCVPLKVNSRIVGVLEVVNKRDESGFTSSDVDLLMTMGQLIAVALENAWLFSQERSRVQHLESVSQVSQSIISDLDLTAVLTRIAESVLLISSADRSELMLCNLHQPSYELRASAGLGADRGVAPTAIPLDRGVAGWAISKRRAVVIHRANQDPRYLAHPLLPDLDSSSVAAFPLFYRSQTLGALVVYSVHGAGFD
ncbi:MAG: GAF domain-containing protein, partial [Caldilineaceae bacterium]|nr:GAF domain-containing protein [Caldilineaceae bacterium]